MQFYLSAPPEGQIVPFLQGRSEELRYNFTVSHRVEPGFHWQIILEFSESDSLGMTV